MLKSYKGRKSECLNLARNLILEYAEPFKILQLFFEHYIYQKVKL